MKRLSLLAAYLVAVLLLPSTGLWVLVGPASALLAGALGVRRGQR